MTNDGSKVRVATQALVLAWVLWEHAQLTDITNDRKLSDDWGRHAATDTRDECSQSARLLGTVTYQDLMTKFGDGKLDTPTTVTTVTNPLPGVVVMRTVAPRATFVMMKTFECWPDTVDPRR